MKKLIVVALMASAAFAAPTSICDASNVVTGAALILSAGDSVASGCRWEDGASVTTDGTSKSLAITGGSTEGALTITVAPVRTDPFRLEVRGVVSVKGGLTISGALPKDSSVLVTGCTFDAKPTNNSPTLLDLSTLTAVTKSTVTAEGNIFKVDFSTADDALAATCVALGGSIDGSTIAIRGNDASVTAHASRANTVTGLLAGTAANDVSVLRSSVFFTSNKVKGAGKVSAVGASIVVKESTAVANAPSSTVWSTVTDKQARETYGKSSFEIAGNVLEAVAADVTAWTITDNVGSDWTIKGTEAKSTDGAVTGTFSLPKAYYGISVSVDGNKLQASGAPTVTPSIAFEVDVVPPNSAVRANGNTLVSGATANVAAFVLAKETFLDRSSDFAIENNVLAAVDGRKIDLTGTQVVVEYTFPGPATGRSAPVALCGNTVFGNKISTNALVDETIKATNEVNLLVADVDKCALRRRSAAPQRAAASAAGALASIAVAGAALLVL